MEFIYNIKAFCESNNIRKSIIATVAQLVEQRIRNAQAVGSSPTSSSKGRDYLCLLFFLYNLVKRLSWTKLRAHPVDGGASIMR